MEDSKHSHERLTMCCECGKICANKSSLISHVKWRHGANSDSQDKLVCKDCGVRFTRTFNLRRHVSDGCGSKHGTKFSCPICSLVGDKNRLLVHYQKGHKINMDREYFQFESFDGFLVWKEQLESETHYRYVKKSGKHVTKDGEERMSFVCHRDGHFRQKGKIRATKLGSNKIGGFCPAKILVSKNEAGVAAVFYKSHVGHKAELERIRLSKREKDELAEQMYQKVPFDSIIEESKTSDNPRLRLLTRKDLHNICQEYDLKEEVVYASDNRETVITMEDWDKKQKQRHNKSKRSIVVVKDGYWAISSNKKKEVFKITATCVNCDCLLRCNDCDVCAHIYKCTCADNAIHQNMCKHIHSVCRFLQESNSQGNFLSHEEDLPIEETKEGFVEEKDLELFKKSKIDAINSMRPIFDNITTWDHLKAFRKYMEPIPKVFRTVDEHLIATKEICILEGSEEIIYEEIPATEFKYTIQ